MRLGCFLLFSFLFFFVSLGLLDFGGVGWFLRFFTFLWWVVSCFSLLFFLFSFFFFAGLGLLGFGGVGLGFEGFIFYFSYLL